MFLQLSGQKFINLEHVAAVEFGPLDASVVGRDGASQENTDFMGLEGRTAYNTAYLYYLSQGRKADGADKDLSAGYEFPYTTLHGDDARILAAYFDQHRQR